MDLENIGATFCRKVLDIGNSLSLFFFFWELGLLSLFPFPLSGCGDEEREEWNYGSDVNGKKFNLVFGSPFKRIRHVKNLHS